jgi:hypothetical protein
VHRLRRTRREFISDGLDQRPHARVRVRLEVDHQRRDRRERLAEFLVRYGFARLA